MSQNKEMKALAQECFDEIASLNILKERTLALKFAAKEMAEALEWISEQGGLNGGDMCMYKALAALEKYRKAVK